MSAAPCVVGKRQFPTLTRITTKITKNPKAIYICDFCLYRVQNEANEYNKPKKPIG